MTMISALLRIIAAILLVILLIQPAFSWWEDGHVLINRTAALKIPDSMPGFMRKAAERIAYLGPEPDRWRERSEFSLKNSQEPDHFIDLERVSDIPELPPGRYDFYRMLYAKRVAAKDHGDDFLPEKVGTQPYITMEIYDRLKVAFRDYRRLAAAESIDRGRGTEHRALRRLARSLRRRRLQSPAHHHSVQRLDRRQSQRLHHQQGSCTPSSKAAWSLALLTRWRSPASCARPCDSRTPGTITFSTCGIPTSWSRRCTRSKKPGA